MEQLFYNMISLYFLSYISYKNFRFIASYFFFYLVNCIKEIYFYSSTVYSPHFAQLQLFLLNILGSVSLSTYRIYSFNSSLSFPFSVYYVSYISPTISFNSYIKSSPFSHFSLNAQYFSITFSSIFYLHYSCLIKYSLSVVCFISLNYFIFRFSSSTYMRFLRHRAKIYPFYYLSHSFY